MRPSLKSRKRLNLPAELRLNSYRSTLSANDPVFAELLHKQNKSWTKTWIAQTANITQDALHSALPSEPTELVYRWWEN